MKCYSFSSNSCTFEISMIVTINTIAILKYTFIISLHNHKGDACSLIIEESCAGICLCNPAFVSAGILEDILLIYHFVTKVQRCA